MKKPSGAYTDYATCSVCGLKKFCKLDMSRFLCYSCSNGNFSGLRGLAGGRRKKCQQ